MSKACYYHRSRCRKAGFAEIISGSEWQHPGFPTWGSASTEPHHPLKEELWCSAQTKQVCNSTGKVLYFINEYTKQKELLNLVAVEVQPAQPNREAHTDSYTKQILQSLQSTYLSYLLLSASCLPSCVPGKPGKCLWKCTCSHRAPSCSCSLCARPPFPCSSAAGIDTATYLTGMKN